MFNLITIELKHFLQVELMQSFELVFIFAILYGIIIYLLMTADHKKYFQRQK